MWIDFIREIMGIDRSTAAENKEKNLVFEKQKDCTLMSWSAPPVARNPVRRWKSRVRTGFESCHVIWTVPPFIFATAPNGWMNDFYFTWGSIVQRFGGKLSLLIFDSMSWNLTGSHFTATTRKGTQGWQYMFIWCNGRNLK